MRSVSGPQPTASRRLAALAALALAAVVAVGALVLVVREPVRLLVVIGLLAGLVVALWFALTRSGGLRAAAGAVAGACLAGTVAVLLRGAPVVVLSGLALLAVAVALGRYATARDVRSLKAAPTPGTPVPAAARPVLIMNLRSGGGKAERFGLVEQCRRRGIEPVVLGPDDDLRQLAVDAIDAGADVIGMAGGDGSQALVATVAAERGVPMVVVPAGTRNHLALDLGIDRDDVVGALDAFGAATEQPMDLAEVNGRTFVNNVSLGLYATIVASPEYRDAKVDTTLAALPTVLGPGTEPFDLRFQGPDGAAHEGAHLIQVSNGTYSDLLSAFGSRTSVCDGQLGVLVVEVPDDLAATRLLGAVAGGRVDRYEGFLAWEATTFEVASDGPVAVGLDGEAVELDPPLRFSVQPAALRVRLAPDAIGYSPAALQLPASELLPALWRVARGHPTPVRLGARGR